MANKNSLEVVKNGCNQIKRHDANLLTTVGSDIGLWPSIDYAKHKAS